MEHSAGAGVYTDINIIKAAERGTKERGKYKSFPTLFGKHGKTVQFDRHCVKVSVTELKDFSTLPAFCLLLIEHKCLLSPDYFLFLAFCLFTLTKALLT